MTFNTSDLRHRSLYERHLTNTSPTLNSHTYGTAIRQARSSFTDSYNNHETHNTQEWSGKLSKLTRVLGEEIQSAAHKFSSTVSDQSRSNIQSAPQTPLVMIKSILQGNTSYHIMCEAISKTCTSCSVKDLIQIYPLLLHNIFGYTNFHGWGLCKYEIKSYPYEFNAIHKFLAPGGCLFQLIERIVVDQDAMFAFPCSSLPTGIMECIENGQIPLWYEKKLKVLADNQIVINFNAQEYFFACFAHYVRHPQVLQQPSQWSGIEDILYVHLLEEYLRYFFPIDAQVSSTWSPVHTYAVASVKSPVNHSLLKSDIWKSTQIMSPIHPTQFFHAESQSECFLKILCDFWLSLNSEEYIFKQQECKLPSIDHARVLRILIKYLHTFINKAPDVTQALGVDTYSNFQTHELKSAIPSHLYEGLFLYLQCCFKHWQLDSSFRMVLETWLSFIQPWRYTNQNVSMNDESLDMDLSNWGTFITDNVTFYSVFFQMFLIRAMRYDLKSVRDVQLIYRVMKVFSQPSLCEILREEFDSLKNDPTNLSYGLTSSVKKRSSFERDVDLFSPETINLAQDLHQVLGTTIIGVQHKIFTATQHKRNYGGGFMTRVIEFFMLDESDEGFVKEREDKRLLEYLEQTTRMLASLFKFPSIQNISVNSSLAAMTTSDLPRPTISQLAEDNSLPDCVVTDDGVVLTDRGRMQILQGLRQFEISYSGDPELQPIRSYESVTAVKLLYRVATALNNKYGTRLEMAYKRKDIIGTCMRSISKKLQQVHFKDMPINLPQSLSTTVCLDQLKPRFSLRFAGSYYFMGYFCWMMILARLFGFSWIAILLLGLLVWTISILYHVDSPPKPTRNS